MKKKVEIATNTSSAAEKVERIEQEQKTKRTRGDNTKRVEKKVTEKEVTAKGDSAMGDSTSAAKELAEKNQGKITAKKTCGSGVEEKGRTGKTESCAIGKTKTACGNAR